MNLVKISDLFEVTYGVNLELINLNEVSERSENSLCFVLRTENNNWVSAFVEKSDDVKPISAGTLTVAGGGSVLATFLQPYEYYSGRDLFYLTPKRRMDEREMIYYSICIRRNKYRYSYNRQANKTLRDLFIPEKVPAKFLTLNIKKPSAKAFSSKKPLLSDREWKWFSINDLFEVSGTKTTSKRKLDEIGKGKYPYVTTQSTNNGVEDFYNFYTEEGDVLVIDSAVAGFCSYQGENFSASDHVEKLLPKFKLNKYTGLFLQTIINLEQFRYSYGKKFNQEKIRNTKIKLPVVVGGNPDWQFMEDYIKSLPYSASI